MLNYLRKLIFFRFWQKKSDKTVAKEERKWIINGVDKVESSSSTNSPDFHWNSAYATKRAKTRFKRAW